MLKNIATVVTAKTDHDTAGEPTVVTAALETPAGASKTTLATGQLSHSTVTLLARFRGLSIGRSSRFAA